MDVEKLSDLELIERLEADGYALRAAGGSLRCVIPGGGALEEGLRREIRERKARLLELVRARRVPLSFEQERLWFLDQLSGSRHTAYNMPAAFRIRGKLNADALARALSGLVARHESLRTVFPSEHGEPYQVIRSPRAVRLREEDVEEEGLASVVAAEAVRPFDLRKGPLTRFRLLRLGPEDHVLTFCQHHIVGDGWSTALLLEELSESYAALAAGRGYDIEPLALQYADYALWQRTDRWAERLRRQEEYWLGRLAGLEECEVLPDRKRPPVKTYRGDRAGFGIDAGTAAAARRLAGQEDATVFMVLLAALQALLLRVCSSDDIAVGTPVAGREGGDLEGTAGFFVNTLVMRTRLDGDPSFREALQRVRSTCLEAYAHPEMPLSRLVDVLQAGRDPARSPLFGVMFVLRHEDFGSLLRLPGCEVEELKVPYPTAKFDLAFELTDDGERMAGEVEYNTDLYLPETVERLTGYFEEMLRAGCSGPDRKLSDIDILGPGEREGLLSASSGGDAPFPQEPLPALFREQVRRAPARTALVYGGASPLLRAARPRVRRRRGGARDLPPGPSSACPRRPGWKPSSASWVSSRRVAPTCPWTSTTRRGGSPSCSRTAGRGRSWRLKACSRGVAGERLAEALRLMGGRAGSRVPPVVYADWRGAAGPRGPRASGRAPLPT